MDRQQIVCLKSHRTNGFVKAITDLFRIQRVVGRADAYILEQRAQSSGKADILFGVALPSTFNHAFHGDDGFQVIVIYQGHILGVDFNLFFLADNPQGIEVVVHPGNEAFGNCLRFLPNRR